MLKLKTAPAVDCVVAADVRAYLRMDSTDYDTYLLQYAQTARQICEDYTRRAFITQTWQLMLDAEQVTDAILLPRPPLRSISSITLYDDVGSPTTQAVASYTYDNFSEPGWLTLLPGYSWGYSRDINGFLIEYITGYGATAADVPQAIKTAITETAAGWYNGDVAQGVIPTSAISKLKPYQIIML